MSDSAGSLLLEQFFFKCCIIFLLSGFPALDFNGDGLFLGIIEIFISEMPNPLDVKSSKIFQQDPIAFLQNVQQNGLPTKSQGVILYTLSLSLPEVLPSILLLFFIPNNNIELGLQQFLALVPIHLTCFMGLHIAFPRDQGMVYHFRPSVTEFMDAKVNFPLLQPVVELLYINLDINPKKCGRTTGLPKCLIKIGRESYMLHTFPSLRLVLSFSTNGAFRLALFW